MPPVDASYIPPVPPLIQDYRPYYHTPNELSGDQAALRARLSVSTVQLRLVQSSGVLALQQEDRSSIPTAALK